ncbi:MAG: sigma-70 family RNA polymerase sigma factor [Cytophagales bacterium]|nr:sigma-70 family RNA polymerase sigma factor [Armatimonadota bacterium]
MGEANNTLEDRTAYAEARDETLVIAALLGGLTAFDELVRRYRQAVTFVARQVLGGGGIGAAEDIAQDVFLIAFQSLPSLEEPAKFAGWLYAITRHRARRIAMRERRTLPTEGTDLERLSEARRPDHEAAAADPAQYWERQSQKQEVWDALERLPSEHREVLYLHYCEEWPLARIAAFLSLPETTIKGRLHRSRDAFRRLLTGTITTTKG